MKLLIVLGVVAVVGVASADGKWADQISYRHSEGGTSLKVTQPDGFKVVVTTPEGDKSGTVPELFQLADHDAYVKVTLTAPDGTSWSKKVEVRAKQQAELSVSFTGAGKAEPATHARTYIGKFKNLGKGCSKAYDRTVKAEFLQGDGTVAATVQVDSTKQAELQVAAGRYDVRIFAWDGANWTFVVTAPQDVPAKDGWLAGFGCKPGTSTPTVVGA
jgi:hypothetical protein